VAVVVAAPGVAPAGLVVAAAVVAASELDELSPPQAAAANARASASGIKRRTSICILRIIVD
jgi:hypothetical protein